MSFKRFLGILTLSVLFVAVVNFAYADKEQNRHNQNNNDNHDKSVAWNLKGSCQISYTGVNIAPGPYIHSYNISSVNLNTGAFSGTGFYVPDNSYTENLTGNVTGSNLTFHALYTGTNPGYYLDATGNIGNTGILSGTATSSTGQTFTFVSSASCAKKTTDDHKPLKLDWQKEVNAKQCNATGDPFIDVTQKVKNDVDSGVGGNYWAYDFVIRKIKVYKTGSEGTYCATVAYDGNFTTIAGASPGNTGTVVAGIKGEFEGGYRSTQFTGALLPTSLWPKHGFVGTTDYMCTPTGTCPGFIDWTTQYFSSTPGYDLAWWGWVYNTGDHGGWINALSGNSGDIL